MPSSIILLLALASCAPSADAALATLDRAVPVASDCTGKKRVLTGPARAKRMEPRKRCHVIVPILM